MRGLNTNDQNFLMTALKRWGFAYEAEINNRTEALADVDVYLGNTWTDVDRNARMNAGRPCESVNIVQQFVRQVTNEQRMQNKGIVARAELPGDEEDEKAEIIQGLCRHIEQSSHADVTYETSFQQMAIGGFGWGEIDVVAESPVSWAKKIIIRPIQNQFSVYDDPAAVRFDRRDSNWRFITEDIPWEDFKEQYGEDVVTDQSFATAIGDTMRQWWTDKTVRVANYWYCKHIKRVKCLMMGGDGRWEDELKPEERYFVVDREPVDWRQVCWVKMTAAQILDKGTWKGQWIPQVPMLGDETTVSGVRILKGMVRNAREPQRRYNYLVTTLVELLMMIPKAPVVGAAGQFENFEREWAAVNNRMLAYLEYNPISVQGTLVPPPARISYSADIEKLVVAIQQCESDVRAAMGMYQASLGERERDESGVALKERKMAGDMANLNYADNESRAIQCYGEMIVDLIPYVYDTPRIIQIVRPNGQTEPVLINQKYMEGNQEREFDLKQIAVGITIDSGPSEPTTRKATQQTLIEIMKVAGPEQQQVLLPEIIRNTDMVNAGEVAEQLEQGLPPQYQKKRKDQPEVPPEIQQMIQAMGTQNKALQAALERAEQTINQKQIEADSKERIEAGKNQIQLAKMQNDLVLEQMKIDAGNSRALMAAEFGKIQTQMDQLHEAVILDVQHERTKELGDLQHGQAKDLAAQQAEQAQAAAEEAVPA